MPTTKFPADLALGIRNSFGPTGVVTFGLSTELGRVSDVLLSGSLLCAAMAIGSEAVLAFFEE